MTTHNTPTDGRGAYKKFICLACGYIYDEALGDPEDGLPAGTRFEDISDDWQCPLCGVKKSDFIPYEENAQTDSTAVFFEPTEGGIVIIGGGLAGWSVVEAIRALDTEIAITLIASDSADRYHKPMLSVAISQGKTPSDLVRTSAIESAKNLNVRLLADTFVTHIDANSKRLHTTRGHVVYDNLVLAIGASPAYPPTIAKEMAWHVNSLERFAGLQQRLAKDGTPKNVAIVGAGMVGTELAEDLAVAGHKVSLIDVNQLPLSALLPSIAGERILNAIKQIGVNWLGASMINEVNATKDGYQVMLTDCANGESTALIFDEIIVATGLLVNERLPLRAGITFSKHTGIAVNPQTLQTSVPNIYALGDCISIDGMPCRYVAPHRPQAAAIASQLLGKDGIYTHKPPMIRLKNKCISVTANGYPKSSGDWQIISQTPEEMVLEMSEQGEVVAKVNLKGKS